MARTTEDDFDSTGADCSVSDEEQAAYAHDHGIVSFLPDDDSHLQAAARGRNEVLYGTFIDLQGTSRRALLKRYTDVHGDSAEERWKAEATALGQVNERGVGPQLLVGLAPNVSVEPDPQQSDARPYLIIEDVGIGLNQVLCSLTQTGAARVPRFDGVGGEVAITNETWECFVQKVLFDLAWQLDALLNGQSQILHGDIKLQNICVAAWGPDPADVRATLIDFETADRDGLGGGTRGVTKAYHRQIEDCDCTTNRAAYDLGCLALVAYQLNTFKLLQDNTPIINRACFADLPTAPCFRYLVDENASELLFDSSQLTLITARIADEFELADLETLVAVTLPVPSEHEEALAVAGGRYQLDAKDITVIPFAQHHQLVIAEDGGQTAPTIIIAAHAKCLPGLRRLDEYLCGLEQQVPNDRVPFTHTIFHRALGDELDHGLPLDTYQALRERIENDLPTLLIALVPERWLDELATLLHADQIDAKTDIALFGYTMRLSRDPFYRLFDAPPSSAIAILPYRSLAPVLLYTALRIAGFSGRTRSDDVTSYELQVAVHLERKEYAVAAKVLDKAPLELQAKEAQRSYRAYLVQLQEARLHGTEARQQLERVIQDYLLKARIISKMGPAYATSAAYGEALYQAAQHEDAPYTRTLGLDTDARESYALYLSRTRQRPQACMWYDRALQTYAERRTINPTIYNRKIIRATLGLALASRSLPPEARGTGANHDPEVLLRDVIAKIDALTPNPVADHACQGSQEAPFDKGYLLATACSALGQHLAESFDNAPDPVALVDEIQALAQRAIKTARATANDPDGSIKLANILNNAGEAYLKLKEPHEALEVLTEAEQRFDATFNRTETHPALKENQSKLARAYQMLGTHSYIQEERIHHQEPRVREKQAYHQLRAVRIVRNLFDQQPHRFWRNYVETLVATVHSFNDFSPSAEVATALNARIARRVLFDELSNLDRKRAEKVRQQLLNKQNERAHHDTNEQHPSDPQKRSSRARRGADSCATAKDVDYISGGAWIDSGRNRAQRLESRGKHADALHMLDQTIDNARRLAAAALHPSLSARTSVVESYRSRLSQLYTLKKTWVQRLKGQRPAGYKGAMNPDSITADADQMISIIDRLLTACMR